MPPSPLSTILVWTGNYMSSIHNPPGSSVLRLKWGVVEVPSYQKIWPQVLDFLLTHVRTRQVRFFLSAGQAPGLVSPSPFPWSQVGSTARPNCGALRIFSSTVTLLVSRSRTLTISSVMDLSHSYGAPGRYYLPQLSLISKPAASLGGPPHD